MLTKAKYINIKTVNKSGDMVDSHLLTTFGINSPDGSRESAIYGRRTTDERRT